MGPTTVELQTVRLLLVGVGESFARSLVRNLEVNPRVTFAGVVPSVEIARILLPSLKPDIVMFDWSAICQLPRDLAQKFQQNGLCILCVVDDCDMYRETAKLAGADEVISRDDFDKELWPLLSTYFPERFGTMAGSGH
jgi:hypothetical protein